MPSATSPCHSARSPSWTSVQRRRPRHRRGCGRPTSSRSAPAPGPSLSDRAAGSWPPHCRAPGRRRTSDAHSAVSAATSGSPGQRRCAPGADRSGRARARRQDHQCRGPVVGPHREIGGVEPPAQGSGIETDPHLRLPPPAGTANEGAGRADGSPAGPVSGERALAGNLDQNLVQGQRKGLVQAARR